MPATALRHRSMRSVASMLLVVAMMATAVTALASPARAATAVFVNELHYDNTGADDDEFVEIAAPAGTDLTGWTVVFYNGSQTRLSPYASVTLSGLATDAGDGFGFVVVDHSGIQNGGPDGLALVHGSTVVQFLSYEGAFTAASGPAEGLTSDDIDVAEDGDTPEGHSLQLGGSGTTYEDFTWEAPQPATPGAPNAGQAFGSGTVDRPISMTCEDIVAVEGHTAAAPVTASDPDETVTDLTITAVEPATTAVSLSDVRPASAPGGAASADLVVTDTVAPGEYAVTVQAVNDDGESVTCTIVVDVLELVPIGTVQGVVDDGEEAADSLQSPLVGEQVAVQGVIYQRTLTDSGQHGFFLQNTGATDDDDPRTSDGVFVFMGRFEDLIDGYVPTVGDEVTLTGRVTEFFSLTQLSSVRRVATVRTGADLDAELPAFEIAPPDVLEEAHRYWERREGMRAQVPAGSVVQGGRDVFGGDDGELWAIRGDHPVAQRTEPYSGRVFRDAHPLDDNPGKLFDDGNGYRFLMGSFGLKYAEGDPAALIAPGRTFDTITNAPVGGVYFSFGKYVVEIGQQLALAAGADPAGNAPPEPADRDIEYAVATANVENLYDFRDDPFDGCDFDGNEGCPGVNPPFDYVPADEETYRDLLDGLAAQIALDLHAPDIVLVQEAEDQDICTVDAGALLCGDSDDADGRPDTLQELALVIEDNYGVAYDAAYDRDGADDRGIVAAHLYRTDRVELLPADEDDPVLGSSPQIGYETAPLPYSDDVQNPKALNAELPGDVVEAAEDNDADYFELDGTDVFTRDPQVARFRVWRDDIGASAYTDVWAISNHFSSGPDARVLQRTEQAAFNAAIVAAIEAADPDANVVVGGDFNVFPRPDDPYGRGNPFADGVSDQLGPLYEAGLENLWDAVLADAPASAYSYVFDGQAQTLDSLFVNDALADEFRQARFAHINADWPAEFDGDGARGVSDHDPMVARFLVVGGLEDLLLRLGQLADAGAIDDARTERLRQRIERIERFLAGERTGAACGQLSALAAQIEGWSPRFIDAPSGAILADTARALYLLHC